MDRMSHTSFIRGDPCSSTSWRILSLKSRVCQLAFSSRSRICISVFNLMHRALRIAEIMLEISWHTDRGSLPGLALTCRKFERPALDALWRNLPSLEPIIVSCLPTHTWGSPPGERILLKPIDKKAWDIFDKYAPRVRSITQSGDPSFIIEHLRILVLSYPSSTMFPNLRSLTWNCTQIHLALEFLRMALVPSLVSLNLRITSISPALMSILSIIGATCPNLTYFRSQIDDPTFHHDFAPFLTPAICQLRNLSALSVCDLDDTGMKHVTQLESLKTFWLYIAPTFLRRTRLSPQSLSFKHLDHLGLQAPGLDLITDVLRYLRTVQTKHFTAIFQITVFEQQSGSISRFCGMLLERCDKDTLEAITLGERFLVNTFAQPSDFSPLRLFHNLTHFDIEAACTLSISDDELSELVDLWPKLKIFKFSYLHHPGSTSLPTFHGLINVLRLCPKLVSISLVIDTTQLDGIVVTSRGNGIRNGGLQELVLGNSLISSPWDVALVLSSLFPNLAGVNLAPWFGDPPHVYFRERQALEQWMSVNYLLGGFRTLKTRCLGQ
ncbi:hypothetical protein DEU56DRAFT_816489 [Suillus clintonianus]|uniref:uncharacterized protein n=1 Tax=Suillus clintonianus TaxID=1904413 RepID=UPI001B85F53F|nr:uncharacterized protein DEU56DRAFT_816489 [Suillus clintonianus]KAG2129739.1 hypothetical protein DEU56DRAFT_816489 [Suillus clintonianus]